MPAIAAPAAAPDASPAASRSTPRGVSGWMCWPTPPRPLRGCSQQLPKRFEGLDRSAHGCDGAGVEARGQGRHRWQRREGQIASHQPRNREALTGRDREQHGRDACCGHVEPPLKPGLVHASAFSERDGSIVQAAAVSDHPATECRLATRLPGQVRRQPLADPDYQAPQIAV